MEWDATLVLQFAALELKMCSLVWDFMMLGANFAGGRVSFENGTLPRSTFFVF
jgi:hypothetical protein